MPLVQTSKEQRSECQRFANHLKKTVSCPGLLPDPIPVSPTSAATLCPREYGALGEGSCGPAGIEVMGNLFELSQSNFQVPPGYVGVSFVQSNGSVAPETSINGGALGHFVFMSGTDTARRHDEMAVVGAECWSRPIAHPAIPRAFSVCMDTLPSSTSAQMHQTHRRRSRSSKVTRFWSGTTAG